MNDLLPGQPLFLEYFCGVLTYLGRVAPLSQRCSFEPCRCSRKDHFASSGVLKGCENLAGNHLWVFHYFMSFIRSAGWNIVCCQYSH
jgi:hypothetical protein